MSYRDYVEARSRREPRFQAEVDAATAEVEVGALIVNRWHERNLSVADLTDITGIAGERLEAIEAGEALTLHEVLWLLHALDLSIAIDQEFHVTSRAPKLLRRSVG